MDDLTNLDFNDKKTMATAAAIFFGFVGAHKFVMGYKREGAIMALVSLAAIVTHLAAIAALVGVVGFIEAFIYFGMDRKKFDDTYLRHQRPWF
ncbi:MAG TPA: NINE protein [Oculatellaceae cyanobacterium]